jgi:hypothetical protein
LKQAKRHKVLFFGRFVELVSLVKPLDRILSRQFQGGRVEVKRVIRSLPNLPELVY